MGALELTLTVVAITCFVVAVLERRRGDRVVVELLRREGENRDARTRLVQVFLDEQRRQEDAHGAERLAFRDERGELMNAALSLATNQPAGIAPAWSAEPTEKLYRTESDEIAEARARVSEQIDEMLQARPPMMPDMGHAA